MTRPVPVLPHSSLAARIGKAFLGLASCIACTVAASAAPRAPPAAIDPGRLESFVDGWMTSRMKSDHVAGAVVSVVQDGKPVLLKGYGVSRQNPDKPVDPSRTLFRVGSIGKTFTWILLMQQVEAGKLDLDQPVNRYLPLEARVPDQGFKRPILIRDLMAHSAGFDDRNFGVLFYETPDKILPLPKYLAAHRPARVREPGLYTSYSNYGAALAGEAAVTASGAPDYQTLVEQRILRPAGMLHTTFREFYPPRAGIPAPMAAGLHQDESTPFSWDGSAFKARKPEYITSIAPAGSLYSNGADMARYMTMLLQNGRGQDGPVFGVAAAKAFATPVLQVPRGGNGWLHGFDDLSTETGRFAYGHDGGTLYFSSNMLIVPELRLGVFINVNTSGSARLTSDFPEAIIKAFYPTAPEVERAPDPATAAHAQQYAGDYLHSRRAYAGLEGFIGRLVSAVHVDVDAKGVLKTSGAIAGAYVSGPDPRLFPRQGGGGYLYFSADGAKPTSFIMSQNSLVAERAPWWQRPVVFYVVGGAGLLTAVATLGAVAWKRRRFFAGPLLRRGYAALLTVTSLGWVVAAALTIAWISSSEDEAAVAYDWPGPLMGAASAAGLLAAACTAAMLILSPLAIMSHAGGSRVRRAGEVGALAIFACLAVLMGALGFLSPLG